MYIKNKFFPVLPGLIMDEGGREAILHTKNHEEGGQETHILLSMRAFITHHQ